MEHYALGVAISIILIALYKGWIDILGVPMMRVIVVALIVVLLGQCIPSTLDVIERARHTGQSSR
mgnify:FL=1